MFNYKKADSNLSPKQNSAGLPPESKPFLLPVLLIIAILIVAGAAIYRWQNLTSPSSKPAKTPTEVQQPTTNFFNGVITAIDKNSITVKATANQTQTINLSLPSEIKILPTKPNLPKTATISSITTVPVKASASDLKVGDTVLVLIRESGGKIIKQEIEIMR